MSDNLPKEIKHTLKVVRHNEKTLAKFNRKELKIDKSNFKKIKKAKSFLEDLEEELEDHHWMFTHDDAEDLKDDNGKEVLRNIYESKHEAASLETLTEKSIEIVEKIRELLGKKFGKVAEKETQALAKTENFDMELLDEIKDDLLPACNVAEIKANNLMEAIEKVGNGEVKDAEAFLKEKINICLAQMNELAKLETFIHEALEKIKGGIAGAMSLNDEDLTKQIEIWLAQAKDQLTYKGGLEPSQKKQMKFWKKAS